MKFEHAYDSWQRGGLTQEEAAQLLGACTRTFRRWTNRFEDERMDGLIDRRLGEVSSRRAPMEVMSGNFCKSENEETECEALKEI